MDSYVVRIYRRGGKKSRILVGTVEVAGARGRWPSPTSRNCGKS